MSDDLLTQAVAVYVGVDFRCPDAFMTQHTLDCPQVGPAFQQVCGKGMPEGMRTDCLFDAGHSGQFLDDMEYHDAGNVLAEPADEYKIFVSGLDQSGVPVRKVVVEFADCFGRNRDQTLFAPFPLHLDKAFVQIEIRQLEVAELGNTQSAAVQCFQNGPVALSFPAAAVNASDQPVNFFHRQNVGQMTACLRRFQQLTRILLYVVLQ